MKRLGTNSVFKERHCFRSHDHVSTAAVAPWRLIGAMACGFSDITEIVGRDCWRGWKPRAGSKPALTCPQFTLICTPAMAPLLCPVTIRVLAPTDAPAGTATVSSGNVPSALAAELPRELDGLSQVTKSGSPAAKP